jgi:peptidyl-prolyl cis-trans isomerase C
MGCIIAVYTTFAVVNPAAAQLLGKPEPSPAAPGDLTKPTFDVTTPLYDVANSMEKSANTVVAEVDGRAITLGDLGDAIRELPGTLSALPFEQLYPIVLEQLIRQQALVIRRKVKAAADRALANALLRKEAGDSIKETDLLARYKQEYANKPGPEEVHVRVIMAPTEAEAAALLTEVKGGADFATVARRASKDTTAPVGGDLGFLRRDRLNPEIGAVAFALQPGQVADFPIVSNNSWFVVKSEERRQQPPPLFAEVREQLFQAMVRERVPGIIKAAVSGVVVREYNISGKEAEGSGTRQ